MEFAVETTPLLANSALTERDFLELLQDGSTEEALLALDNGMNPNCKDISGTSALCIAISLGDTQLVEKLLQCGADISTGHISYFQSALKAGDIPDTPSALVNWVTLLTTVSLVVDYAQGPILPDPIFFVMSIISVAEYVQVLQTKRRLDPLHAYLLGWSVIMYLCLHIASSHPSRRLTQFCFALLHSRSWWTYLVRSLLSYTIQSWNLNLFRFIGVWRILMSPGHAVINTLLDYQGSSEDMFMRCLKYGMDLGDPGVVGGNLTYRIWLWATAKGHTAVVEHLLNMGLPAFMHAPYGDDEISDESEDAIAIVAAARLHNEAIVTLLLNFGAGLYTPKVLSLALIACVKECPHDINKCASIISSLLMQGADSNATDKEGRSALSWTCEYSTSESTAVPLLASCAGNTIFNVDKHGRTALHHASWKHTYGSNAIITMLLDAGAPIDAVDEQGHTPLWLAASLGWAPDVALLLLCGASIDFCGQGSTTPLMEACRHNNMAVISILLSEGADPNAQTENDTPLISALWRRWSEPMGDVVNVLLGAGASPLMPPDFPCQPLVESVETTESGGDFTFEILEAAQARGGIPEGLLNSALTRIAMCTGFRLDLVRALVTAGADPRQRIPFEKNGTVLHLIHNREDISFTNDDLGNETYQDGITTTIPILLSRGASLDDTNEDGCMPLHLAVGSAKLFTVEQMIKFGANINAVDGFLQTPLHYACKKPPSQWTGYIPLGHHPDLEGPEFYGQRMQRLRHAHIQERTRLVMQSIAEEDIITILLQHDANPYTRDHKVMSPLHLACQVGNPITAGVILRNRSSARRKLEARVTYSLSEVLRAMDINCMTPLHWATKSGNVELVQMILAADLSTTFRSGENTYQDIISPPQHLALDPHAVNAKDNSGRTPLDYAREEGHAQIVSLFLEEVNMVLDCRNSSPDERTPSPATTKEFHEDLNTYVMRIALPGRWCNLGCRWCVYQWGWLKHGP